MNTLTNLIDPTATPRCTITDEELRRVRRFLATCDRADPRVGRQASVLEARLAAARVVGVGALPRSVVTMYSTVKVVDLERREAFTYTIAYPARVSELQSHISLLSPRGTALLGATESHVVECVEDDRVVRLVVKEILYQPEWDQRNRFADAGYIAGR